MELWGFESIRSLPGDGFGLFDAEENTKRIGIRERAAADKYAADRDKEARIEEATAFKEAKLAEVQAMVDARTAEATAMADARKFEAEQSAETRKLEAIERADTSRRESDNMLRAEKDQNMTMRWGIMKNSQDTQFQIMAWLSGQLEGFDTKTQIAMKDAEVRMADIRATQRIEEGKLKVDERELEIRAIEAARAGNMDTGSFTA